MGLVADAVNNNDLSRLNQLLEDGNDVEDLDKMHESALIKAAALNNSDMVIQLIKSGANINLQDKAGCTALMHSARNKINSVLKILVEAGANYNIKNNGGKSALAIAVYNGHMDAVKDLLHQPDISIDASIIESLPKNNPDMIDFILTYCINRNINLSNINHSRVSLLVQLVRGHYYDALESLLNDASHMHLVTNDMQKDLTDALYYSINVGAYPLAKALIASGANLLATDSESYTPLMRLVSRSEVKKVNSSKLLVNTIEEESKESNEDESGKAIEDEKMDSIERKENDVSMIELVKIMLPLSDLSVKTKIHGHDAAALAGLSGRYHIGKTIKAAMSPDEKELKLTADLAKWTNTYLAALATKK